MASALQVILDSFRNETPTVRDQGTSFEKLMIQYFKKEPFYKNMYSAVISYADWVKQYGPQFSITKNTDTGIDLVAITADNKFHAIQCKNYATDYHVRKSDIDSFFTASGKRYFSYRVIVTTTDHWSKNALDALEDQTPPVSRISLHDLENSQIDWSTCKDDLTFSLKPQKQLRDHQKTALQSVLRGLERADRGKLIMACGTGKTFTSLQIAQSLPGTDKLVLFLVPSLSVLSQTITEWTQQADITPKSFAVCSDSNVGKHKNQDDDRIITGLSDLQYPATTNARALRQQVAKLEPNGAMTVIFSTYHSIDVLHQAQNADENPLPAFDLIICDEAHRTTGATFEGEEESAFVRVHNNDYLKGKKRLYMTATPRIYGETAKQTEGVELCSMDDESIYGKELYVLTFSEAVARKLLVDYKVIVLAVEESHINRRLQSLLSDEDNALKVNDAAKIVGCWKALSKQGLFENSSQLAKPMRRAVAFCQVIEHEYRGNKHKVSSKLIAQMFSAVVKQYQQAEIADIQAQDPQAKLDPALSMVCEAEHVDGGMDATEKEAKLAWLKADTPENTCRVLSNVRCLSEGVDVPALDAVLFLTPRSSQVDVVQSVGRVMRLSPGKHMGYVILPVVIPAGIEPERALDNNETYRVVWQVLNALRAHDDRFDAMINRLEFNGSMPSKMEVVAVAETVLPKPKRKTAQEAQAGKAKGTNMIGTKPDDPPQQGEITFPMGNIERALYAKIVKKCGNRYHWEDWANDVAKIAQTHIDRIKAILENPQNQEERKAFENFVAELHDDLNNSISEEEVIEMLAQHLITKPVFDALFDEYQFTRHNPISIAMQKVLDTLQAHHLAKEADTLKSFYDSVKMRAEGINSAEGKQRIVLELYDKFFRNAFPQMTDRLGIVYTPVEVVDFIIHSVEHALRQEFNSSLANTGVHILDPFTGTGTFITRLLQSGLIPAEKLAHKYQHEIHANEIVLLAYYLASINIETTYHSLLSQDIGSPETHGDPHVAYKSFPGICLTDTFEMYEKDDLISALLEDNSTRRRQQKDLDIQVIIGNPPYSIGQKSQNDNNTNIDYPNLDRRIEDTYASESKSYNTKGLYDSYIRAIRWASDRIGKSGVIAFVTNAGFLDSASADGLRKCLVKDFSKIYIFHLRGNQRTIGEQSRREGGKIFGSGSRAPISISILVKNIESEINGKIYFHDIGDYLSREEKLERISYYKSIKGISNWQDIHPDIYGDWINQRDSSFIKNIIIGDKKTKKKCIFEKYSLGVGTNRDAWTYNYSTCKLLNNISKAIIFFNSEVERFNMAYNGNLVDKKTIDNFIEKNTKFFSWDTKTKAYLKKGKKIIYDENSLRVSMYRPFSKIWLYFSKDMNNSIFLTPLIFPNSDSENKVISLTGIGNKSFSAIMTNVIPDIQTQFNGQCFPLYIYDVQNFSNQDDQPDLLGGNNSMMSRSSKTINRRYAITDLGLAHFQDAYPDIKITKLDLFYYIYGILHSHDYVRRYADNLNKELPRIPRVKRSIDFLRFSNIGQKLGNLHINYEQVDPYPLTVDVAKINSDVLSYRVDKMKIGKRKDENGKNVDDLSTVIYNRQITLKDIPIDAWNYVVNGKPALQWVIERQVVKIDKPSGIVNDANDWAMDTMHNPKYPLELFQRIVTVSLETQRLIKELPPLEILDN